MLIFWDFSKFLKILKSVIQYLCRDISNVKIGLYLRSSHKKDWKTHFWPYSLKKSKKWKKKTRAPPHFSVSFRQKKNFENRTTVAMRLVPPPSPRHSKSSTPVYILNFQMNKLRILKILHIWKFCLLQFVCFDIISAFDFREKSDSVLALYQTTTFFLYFLDHNSLNWLL